ncbi:NAD(P)H-hydrate epimerase [Amnibacterium sp.]|uniref:NAD(P)H-hydrate epimerase n=1 Tax=Amnibacterium sp. TaxID=1872496 RepID=UPI003F7BC083
MSIDAGRGYTAAEVREAERPLLEAGVPLMARAAAGLAGETARVLAARGTPRGSVLVLAGSGSNGGDALFAAASLAARGHVVVVARLGTRVHEPGLRAAQRAGAVLLPPDATAGRVLAAARRSDVVLDGLLGTGAAGGLRPPAREVVARLAEARLRAAVVAVDLPSGVDPDSGAVRPPVLAATRTVTFGAVKAGLLAPTARAVAGDLVLVDIGLEPFLPDRQR